MRKHEFKKIFDYYRKEGETGHHQKRMHLDRRHRKRGIWIKNFLTEILDDKNFCLDVGCAEGWYTKWMSKKTNFVAGIDLSLPKLRRAIKESDSPKTSYIQAS